MDNCRIITAFLIGQLIDVSVFHFKSKNRKTQNMVKSNRFNLVSQFIDSFVVLFIAFYIGAGWELKLVIAIGIVNMKISKEEALDYHSQGRKGKIEVIATKPCLTSRDLSLAYTPGVAEPCREIEKNVEDVYKYTAKGNLVAVISNGTAVLGLGDIGPEAGKPVMEGKEFCSKDLLILMFLILNFAVKIQKKLSVQFSFLNQHSAE
jgi:hypothetical protein